MIVTPPLKFWETADRDREKCSGQVGRTDLPWPDELSQILIPYL